MGVEGAVVIIGALIALGMVVWGGFSTRRSIVVAVVALGVTFLAAGCGMYAFTESNSLPWAIGYGVIAMLSLGVGIKHLVGNRGGANRVADS